MIRRGATILLVGLLSLGVSGCAEPPTSVAFRSYEGVPSDYKGSTSDLRGVQYHVEWLDGGKLLSVSTVSVTTCTAVPTSLTRTEPHVMRLTMVPNQADFPCRDDPHPVTFEFTAPAGIDHTATNRVQIGELSRRVRPFS